MAGGMSGMAGSAWASPTTAASLPQARPAAAKFPLRPARTMAASCASTACSSPPPAPVYQVTVRFAARTAFDGLCRPVWCREGAGVTFATALRVATGDVASA